MLKKLLMFSACAFMVAAAQLSHSFPVEGVTPVNNREYAPAVQTLLRNARKSIRIMLYQTRYYTEFPDTITNHYIGDFIDARKRGVDVRVIVDTGEWNERGKNEYNLDYLDRLTTAGVQAWEDNPEEVSHQKVLLIDDDISLVASNNWSYYSLAQNNEVAAIIYSRPLNAWFRKYFDDRIAGGKKYPAVTTAPVELSRTIPDDGKPGTPRELPFKKLPAVDVTPIANRDYFPALHDLILSATKSVDVVQRQFNIDKTRPFSRGVALLPGEPVSPVNVLAEDLIAASKRGVKVRVILDQTEEMENERGDETAAYLKSRGIPVFREDLKKQTHAKLVVVDEDKTVLGSTNWTYPALELGNEASVLIKSAEINKVYRDYVEGLLQSGAPYEASSRSIWDTPVPASSGGR